MLAANPYAAMSLAGMGGGGPVANPTAFVQQQLNSFNNLPTNKRGTNSAAFGGGAGADADFQAQRHARRLYVGSIPPGSNDRSVEAFFVDIFRRTITPPDMDWLREHGAGTQKQPLIVSVHYNETKGYAFVEFNCVELAMAAIDLDGISWNGTCIKVRRPNDFRAEAMAPMRRLITVNKAALGIVSGQVVDGPNKVFIGGLPYHLKDEQVKELLGAFGQLKSFRLVRESGSETSKGYGFFEYLDPSVTAMAVEGLNGMPVGDKSLTVKMAENPMHGGTSAAAQATAAQQALANQSLAFGALAAQMQMGNMPPGLEALGAADGSSDLGTVPTAPRPYYEKDVRVNSVNCTLVLMHMVTSEELMDDEEFGDIVEDVTEECGQYGKVENLWIPRVKDDYPDDRQGNIYVEFDCTASAQKAKQALAGRKFSERTVMVDWFVNNP
jgi:splicing factor U2AF subunit